jgi:hypothetical protein
VYIDTPVVQRCQGFFGILPMLQRCMKSVIIRLVSISTEIVGAFFLTMASPQFVVLANFASPRLLGDMCTRRQNFQMAVGWAM